MKFREFKVEDSEFCFKTRSEVFIRLFYKELGAEFVALCINSILPDDYVKISSSKKIFIVEDNNEKVGFIVFNRVSNKVEIPLIYICTDQLKKGYGSRSMKFIETWVNENWENITHIYLDTIIPNYNGKFYEKIGYKKIGLTHCEFFKKEITAIRYEKRLKQ